MMDLCRPTCNCCNSENKTKQKTRTRKIRTKTQDDTII